MEVVFSTRKDGINQRKHGISFRRAEDFDLTTSLIFPDDSQDYGELRYQAIGFLDARFTCLLSPNSQQRPGHQPPQSREERRNNLCR